MIAISRQLEQKSVKRRYYYGERRPSPAEFRLMIRRDVRSVDGFDIIDVCIAQAPDEDGVICWHYLALCQRDGTTLEAKQAIRNEKFIADMKANPDDTISYLHDELKMEPTDEPSLRPRVGLGSDPTGSH